MDDLEVLYAAIFDNLAIGVCVYDLNGNFLYVNSTMVRWRQISSQQYLNMNVHDFYDGNMISNCVFDCVLREGKAVSRLQQYLSKKQGKDEKHLRIVTGVPLFDKSGRIQNVITYLQDVNEFNNLYHQLATEKKMIASTIPRTEDAGTPKHQIVADSPAMKALLDAACNIAQTDTTVLLYGESGTGKEVLAHYIRDHSLRSHRPFIEVNCATFTETLLDSELFGYEKGSFTGALSTGKSGLIEAAEGGTLFLDEVNSLPLNLQGKFLKLIDEKRFRRIGSEKSQGADFRLIAATNVNLMELVEAGLFRADLYYRLNVVPLTIPPLRERREDIAPLCNFFIGIFSERYGMKKQFSEDALRIVEEYGWPGNVRELRNFVERVVIMTPRDIGVIETVPSELLEHRLAPREAEPPHQKRRHTRQEVEAALKACRGNRKLAAQYLGISRRTLQYRIQEYHLPCKKDGQD